MPSRIKYSFRFFKKKRSVSKEKKPHDSSHVFERAKAQVMRGDLLDAFLSLISIRPVDAHEQQRALLNIGICSYLMGYDDFAIDFTCLALALHEYTHNAYYHDLLQHNLAKMMNDDAQSQGPICVIAAPAEPPSQWP